jgi:hypothetical protein
VEFRDLPMHTEINKYHYNSVEIDTIEHGHMCAYKGQEIYASKLPPEIFGNGVAKLEVRFNNDDFLEKLEDNGSLNGLTIRVGDNKRELLIFKEGYTESWNQTISPVYGIVEYWVTIIAETMVPGAEYTQYQHELNEERKTKIERRDSMKRGYVESLLQTRRLQNPT